MAKKKTALKESSKIVSINISRESVAPDKFVSLYVNDTQVQFSPWDIRCLFGVIDSLATPEKPTVVIKQLGELRMSPQHAKRFAQVLVEQINKYETNFGPIPIREEG